MPPFPARSEEGMQPKLSPAGAVAAVRHRAEAAAEAGAAPHSPSGSNMGHHHAAPPSPAGDSSYAISMTGGAEEGGDGAGGGGAGGVGVGSKGNVFDERFIGKSTASDTAPEVPGSNGFGGHDDAAGPSSILVPAPPAAAAPTREGAMPVGGGGREGNGGAEGSRPTVAAARGGVRADGGNLGVPMVSRTVEFTERTVRVREGRGPGSERRGCCSGLCRLVLDAVEVCWTLFRLLRTRRKPGLPRRCHRESKRERAP